MGLSVSYTCAVRGCKAPAPSPEGTFLYFVALPASEKWGKKEVEPSCPGHAEFALGPDGNLRSLSRSAKLAS